MRKNTKRLLAGSVAVILLGGLYAGIMHLPDPEDSSEPQSVELISIDTSKLSQVHVTIGTEEYTIQCSHTDNKTAYSMAGTDQADYSDSLLQELAEQACSVSGQLIAENCDDLSEYGLSDSNNTVEITDTDNKTTILTLGLSNDVLGGTYCRAGDSNTVYLLDSNTVEALSQKQSYYRNLTVLGSYYSLSSELQSLRIDSMADGSVVSIQARDASSDRDAISEHDTEFMFTQPISCDADDNTLSTGVLSDLQDALTAQAIVEDDPADLGKYGLEQPAARLHITTSNLDATVLVGDTDDDGGIYVMKEGGSTVFLSNASSFEFLKEDWNNWRSTNLMPCALSELSRITVKQADSTHTAVITHTKDDDGKTDDTATLDGKDMTDDALQQLYLAVSSVNYTRLLEEPEDKQPEVTVTLTMTDGSTRSLAFAKGGSREYLVRVDNGTFSYGVGQDDLTSILDALTTGSEDSDKQNDE